MTYDARKPDSNMPTKVRTAISPPTFFTTAVQAEAMPKANIMHGRLTLAVQTLVKTAIAGPKMTNMT